MDHIRQLGVPLSAALLIIGGGWRIAEAGAEAAGFSLLVLGSCIAGFWLRDLLGDR